MNVKDELPFRLESDLERRIAEAPEWREGVEWGRPRHGHPEGTIIELHDEAFNAWQLGHRDGNWDKAQARAERLVERLGDTFPLYLAFYHCDNTTEGKESTCLDWFRDLTQ